jgi:hypothetical protein
MKAKAYEERKESQQLKEDAKTTVPQKSKVTGDGTVDKRKRIEIVRAKHLPTRNRRIPLQKAESAKNIEKVKSLIVPDNLNKDECVSVKENAVSRKQDGTGTGLQTRPRKISARLQSEDGETDTAPGRPPCAPRRSLRRGSREAALDGCDSVQEGSGDTVHQASNSEIPPAGTVPSKSLNRKSKPVPSVASPSPLVRGLRKCSRSQENMLGVSEETFSDSDEEPLGKLALKHSVTRKLNDDVNDSRDATVERKIVAGGETDEVVNTEVSKHEDESAVLVPDDTKKKNVSVKTEQVLKLPLVAAHRGNGKKIEQAGEGIPGTSVMEVLEVSDTSNKELSQRKNEDGARNAAPLLGKSEEKLVTRSKGELPYRKCEVGNSRNKGKLFKISEGENAKKEEIIQRKNKDTSHTENRDLLSRKGNIAKNKSISNRRNEEIAKSSIVPRQNDNVLPKHKEVSYGGSVEDTGTGGISHRKARVCVNARYKETPSKNNNEFGTRSKDAALRKSEDELQTKKKEISATNNEVDLRCKSKEMLLRSSDEVHAKRKQETVRKSCGEVIAKTSETLLKESEENCVESTEISLQTKDSLNNNKIIVSGGMDEGANSKNISEEVRNAKLENAPLRKNEENISKNVETSQKKKEDEVNKIKQIFQRKFENTDTTNIEIPSKENEALSTLNEEILPKSSENFVKNVDKLARKNANAKSKMVEIASVKSEDCLSGVEDSKSFSDDRYLMKDTWFKSEYVLTDDRKSCQPTKSSLSFADVEPLSKGKIIREGKAGVGDAISSREEKFEPHKEMNMADEVKNVLGKFETEILGNNGVDTAKSSHNVKTNILQLKTESQTVKYEKQIISNVTNLSRSNKILPISNKVTFFNTDKKLPNIQMQVVSSSKTNETHVQSQVVPHAGIKTSPKCSLESSDSEDGTSRKLSAMLSNSLSARGEEPLCRYAANSIVPTNDAVLKQGSKATTKYENVPPEPMCRGENGGKVGTKMIIISKEELTTVTGTSVTKSYNKTGEKYTELKVVEVRKGKNDPSSQALGLHAKSNSVLNREPTFRDKVKAKMNMSNEQIEKWLNESYIEEADPKIPMFDKCIESISEEGETLNNIDFIDSTTIRECDYGTSPLEEELKSEKAISYFKEIDDEHLYQSDKDFSFVREEFTHKVVELPQLTPQFAVGFKKSIPHDVALVRPQSAAQNLLVLERGTSSNGVSSLVKEPKSVGVNPIPISQERIEVRTARNREGSEADANKGDAATLKLPRPSCSKTDRNQRYNEEDVRAIEEKINKLRTEAKKQEVNKSQPSQDRGGEKKPIFQQRRSFPHKVKERKDLTPSANAFSPENESSVYAFESEPELPPVSTPFRRRARDSRTSSTTTSKSEEDLARLDDETTSPPSAVQMTVQTVQSPPLQTAEAVQSERLTLPVVGQPMQTLPLSTAIVQIIPTLPITMRPVQVENYGSAQQQQQQQQVLLLQNDSVMTTLKAGCTSSASIAVQVNLDNEPSLDASSQNISASNPATPEPLLQRSMECSTQTDVAEEEDDNEGHLFYIPLQQPTGAGGPLSSPTQQLIQGVAVKLGTEGPTGPNQRVIMRAKLVTKPPTFNRTAVGIQDGNARYGYLTSPPPPPCM